VSAGDSTVAVSAAGSTVKKVRTGAGLVVAAGPEGRFAVLPGRGRVDFCDRNGRLTARISLPPGSIEPAVVSVFR
jgi:hypothetical protein